MLLDYIGCNGWGNFMADVEEFLCLKLKGVMCEFMERNEGVRCFILLLFVELNE